MSAKRTGTQRRIKVAPWCMLCSYCGWKKGTSWDEATSNSEKLRPIAFSIVGLRLAEGIS